MPVRPTLLHRIALASFLLFRKHLGNLREFLGKWFIALLAKNCPYGYGHDSEIMLTCDQVINLEFDCPVRMYFCRRFHNGRNIINTAKKFDGFFRMTRFRYFAVCEYHPQNTCNSDVNLVNRDANLYFFLVLFCPYLASAWLKNNRKS